MLIPDVPPQLLEAFRQAAASQRLALVGGVVRDLLLHRHHQDPWRGLPDLDLVVEGQAGALVSRLPDALERCCASVAPMQVQAHGRYGTYALELSLPESLGGTWLVDLASARQESYAKPADNPEVSPGSLEQDLARRDFSVNAMALQLVSADGTDALLLDPHGGRIDLARRQLRFLHGESLRDDPTRLLRAARYAARLGFGLDSDGLRQTTATLEAWPWPWRPGDPWKQAPPALGTRLRMELELLLWREPWLTALQALQDWGGFVLLDPQLQRDRQWRRRLAWGQRLGVPLLPLFLLGCSQPIAVARRLQLPHGQLRLLQQVASLRERWQQALDSGRFRHASPSDWCQLLEAPGGNPDAVALLLASGAQPRRPLLHWWARWRHVPSPVDGAALLQRGWAPGPELGRELRRLRAERLDGLGSA